MHTIVFDMSISQKQFLAWYRGTARAVHVRARDGRMIRFPANILQPFVTHSGVQGTFELQFDAQHKYQGIRRIG